MFGESGNMKWDVFISHATEDKEEFVMPLANKLKEYGVNVWIDKFTLKLGDSLSKSIDEGLREANYGVVVLSKFFLSKGYTDYELRSLISREIGNRKVILPIWHNINKRDIEQYSYYLTDKFALNSNEQSLSAIAEAIIEIVRPDIYKTIENLHVTKILYENSKVGKMDFYKFSHDMKRIMENNPPKHEELPLDTLVILRLIHEIYKEIDGLGYDERIEIYKYNTNPQREILIESKNAAIYLERISDKDYTIKQKAAIFATINFISIDNSIKYEAVQHMDITKEEFENIKKSFKEFSPNIDSIDSRLMLIVDKNKDE